MYCSHCGNLITTDHVTVCPYCGRSLSQAAYEVSRDPIEAFPKPSIDSITVRPANVLAGGLVVMTLLALFGHVVSIPMLQSLSGEGSYTMLGMLSGLDELGSYLAYGSSSDSGAQLETLIVMAALLWAIMLFLMGAGLYQLLGKKDEKSGVPVAAAVVGTVLAGLWVVVVLAVNSSIVAELSSSYFSYLSEVTVIAPGGGSVALVIAGAITLGCYYMLRHQE